jgi:hypothetical protein
MSSVNTETTSYRAESRLRILIFALLVPIGIWAINHAIAFGLVRHHEFLLGFYVVFVAETAVIAWCVGRYMRHALLRCIVFLWCIAFIDVLFVLFQFTLHDDLCNVGYAFASAQLGLLIAWAVLGTQPLGWRIFAALSGATAVMLYVTALTTGFIMMQSWMRNDWDTILTWQAIATLGLCATLRWRKFRILPIDDDGADGVASSEAGSERVQFSILNVLMWTLALAPIFAVARLVDWNAVEIPSVERWIQFASLAVLLSVPPLVAIWSGLGTGHVILRTLLPLMFTAGAGALLAYATNQGWLQRIDIDMFRFGFGFGSKPYVFWISWTVLAGFFYLAMLLILRATNHRLIRVSARRS